MKKAAIYLSVSVLLLTGCNLARPASPLPSPTILIISPTPATASPTVASPTPPPAPSPTLPAPTATTGSLIRPGSPSGPYAVVLVSPTDVLNIRSGPEVDQAIIGSFAATETAVMRTGRSATVGDDLWVEVQKPGGGTGWVNAYYLTEYVPPATFCADNRVTDLINNLDGALTSNNGVQLAALVSPAHGMTVFLARYSGKSVTFWPEDARWVFDSTYEHNWGMHPASGLEITGSFQDAVLPKLQDVFDATYTLTCNSLGTAPQYGFSPWPEEYANVNYYTVLKPGTPGIDLDWRYWLVGVEYIQGRPYIFALIHFEWEP